MSRFRACASSLARQRPKQTNTSASLKDLGAAQFPVDSATLNLTKMQAQDEHEANPQKTLTEKGQMSAKVAPCRGTPQGAIYSPLALEKAMKEATACHDVLTKAWWDAVRANSKEKPEESDESTAKAPEDDSCDDAAIIAALKSRCLDRISPYLPDGDDPPMIKVLELEYKYDIHHDPPSNDESEEETIPPY